LVLNHCRKAIFFTLCLNVFPGFSLVFTFQVSLLFGTIIRKIPLPGCSHSNSSKNGLPDNSEETSTSTEILDVEQLETMGEHFLQVLLKMKHNGAIDKTRAGLTALCNRLLCSNDSRYVQYSEASH
jgi:thyroid adenoma-associated protein